MWRLLLIAVLVSGCTKVSQSLNPTKVYKRDVKIKYDGTEYIGVAVLPGGKQNYVLEMTFAGTLDLFTFRSCHREVTQEDPGGGKIFGKKNQVAFDYVPVDPIESRKYCAVDVGGYERDGGRHSWAFIDFETPLETLPANVLCNGSRKRYGGVSVCQSPAGLLQQITFAEPVTVQKPDECPEVYPDIESKVWDVYPPLGRCVYSFRESGGAKRFHRLTVLGYQEIMIRKGG